MKEIKFRFWDKRFEQMGEFTLADVWFDGQRVGKKGGTPTYLFGTSGSKVGDFNIMQYTGLKDVSGTDIFEGDIVSIEYDKKTLLFEVVFMDGMYCLRMTEGDFQVSEYMNQGIKVIGNIYENKEFLHKEND